MEDQTIIDGNRYIDSFMGADSGYTSRGFLKSCRYHCSWDWLMPVVEKMESEHRVSVVIDFMSSGVIFFDTPDDNILITRARVNEKIETVWIAIVSFIKHIQSGKDN